MRNKLWMKGVVFGIILLFVTTSVTSFGSTAYVSSGEADVLMAKLSNGGNQPPTPPGINGPHYGKTNTTYEFSLGAITDPDGDQLYDLWDWGDGNMSGWLGPYDSGVTVSASHAWSAPGTYMIKVKMKDSYGAESNWSAPFSIVIVQLKKAFFLGTFEDLNRTEDLVILGARFFIVLPSERIFYIGGIIVISKEYRGHLGRAFILGLGDIAIP